MVIEPKIVGSKAFCSTTSLPEIYKKQNKKRIYLFVHCEIFSILHTVYFLFRIAW